MQPAPVKIVKNMFRLLPLHEQGRCSSDAFWRPRVFFSIKEPGYFDATETKCLKPVHEALDNEVSQHYPKQSNVVT